MARRDAKQRCADWGLPYRPDEFHAAVARVLPRLPFAPDPCRAEMVATGTAQEALSRAEAAAALSRFGAAGVMRHMPEVRPLTPREVDRRRALAVVAQAIVAQIDICETVERAAPTSGHEET
jgi:hypothetical protein